MNQLGIVNGRIYIEGTFYPANLYARDGRVQAITADRLPCRKTVDASGKYVLPGFINPGVHFSGSGEKEISWNHLRTGSINGVLGGITTYLGFLEPVRQVSELRERFEQQMALCSMGAADYGFHVSVSQPLDPALQIMEAGKLLGIPSINLVTAGMSDGYLYDLLKLSGEKQAMILVCTEKEPCSCPVSREDFEIVKLSLMAREAKGYIDFVHVSAGSAVKLVKDCFFQEVQKGLIRLESCPHYFIESRSFGEEDLDSFTAVSSASMEGEGAQYSFVNMYTEFGNSIIYQYTTGPARAHKLYPRKGCLMPGADADIVIFDNTVTEPIQDSRMVRGKIEKVFLRGRQITEGKQFLGSKGCYLGRGISG